MDEVETQGGSEGEENEWMERGAELAKREVICWRDRMHQTETERRDGRRGLSYWSVV